MVCAAWLGGCAGSSNNSAATNNAVDMRGGLGDSPSSNNAVDMRGGLGDSPSSNYKDSSPEGSAGPNFAPAAAAKAADKLTAVSKPGNRSYMIGPMDILDISVFQVPDLTKTVQVGDDGIINYPLVGDVPAAGKTSNQLAVELQQRLGGKYLRSPQVSVFVKEANSQRVTVQGSVKTSGVFSLKGRTTLQQVLAMAGGVNMDTNSGDVVILRTINGTRSAARFDIDAIQSGKSVDPELEPGDVIVVDTSATKLALSNLMKVLPIATTAMIFSGI
jgi:polysaccharide biosynthesis/export protein